MQVSTEIDIEGFTYTAADRQIWEEELDAFVPSKIFDAHYHLWSEDAIASDHPQRGALMEVDRMGAQSLDRQMFPDREIEYLILGTPLRDIDLEHHNRFIADQMRSAKNIRMHRLVTPQCSTEDIRRDIETLGFTGLKPYRIYSSTGDPNQCRIQEFLTHEQMELANDLGLWVTMHLSQYQGCADPDNLADLQEYTTRRYPNIKWILAHCARSFTYYAIRQAVERLRDLPNIWYDTSAVCDVMSHYTLFKNEDHRRVLYGSDNMLGCGFHGSYVSMGRFWYQVGVPTTRGEVTLHTDARPVLVIYQQLLCMKHAAELAELSTSQISDIFYGNASAALMLE